MPKQVLEPERRPSEGTDEAAVTPMFGMRSSLQYRFSLQIYRYTYSAEMCRYHQTSPQSHFTRARICSRATEEGRITLSEMRLIPTSKNGGRQERTLTSQEEYAAILREQFGIVMTH